MRPVVPAILVGLLLPLWSNPSFAADPPVVPHLRELSQTPADDPIQATPTKVESGRYRYYKVDGYVGEVTWEIDGTSVYFREVVKPLLLLGVLHGATEPGEYDVPAQAIVVWGRSEGTTTVKALGVVNGKARTLFKKVFIVGKMPQPPPDPKPDPIDPKPDDPKPPPVVTSFRVLLVSESGATLSSAQNAILYGKTVQDYLTTKTTPEGGLAGWRRYDPQQGTAGEQPNMKALWDAVKPKVTTVPCVVIEVNGKAEILPFPASAAEALTLFKKYKGE